MCRTPDDVKFFGRAVPPPPEDKTDDIVALVEQASYWKESRDRMAAQNMELGAENERLQRERDYAVRWANKAVNDVKAAIDPLAKALEAMLGAIDNNGIDSQEIDGDYAAGIPPHKWHEEWAHHARAALSLSRSGT